MRHREGNPWVPCSIRRLHRRLIAGIGRHPPHLPGSRALGWRREAIYSEHGGSATARNISSSGSKADADNGIAASGGADERVAAALERGLGSSIQFLTRGTTTKQPQQTRQEGSMKYEKEFGIPFIRNIETCKPILMT